MKKLPFLLRSIPFYIGVWGGLALANVGVGLGCKPLALVGFGVFLVPAIALLIALWGLRQEGNRE